MKSVLILGSAPDAVQATKFDLTQFSAVICINNAWLISDEWTHSIFPDDFDAKRRPSANTKQHIVQSDAYVPANNQFGGIIYAGGTMAFTTAYWALAALRPDMMLFLGCDMIYDADQTHFYGSGEADPLRQDPTLQSLEAKSNRLLLMAANHGCLCANASECKKSRLTIPRISRDVLQKYAREFRYNKMKELQISSNKQQMENALALEAQTACFVEGGDYWNYLHEGVAEQLAIIDSLWLEAYASKTTDTAL